MIELLVSVILLLVVIYVVHLVIDALGLPANIKTVAYLIVGLIALFWLLDRFGLYRLS
jgi:hypothetical protein